MAEFSQVARDGIIANIEDIRRRLSLDPIDGGHSEDKKIIETEQEDNVLSPVELGAILSRMYVSSPVKEVAINAFSIKYGDVISNNSYTVEQLLSAAQLPDSLAPQLILGLELYSSISRNDYGVKFYTRDIEGDVDVIRLPDIPERKRTRHSLNCILYGAPGTGKTYTTAQLALSIIEDTDLTTIQSQPRSQVMDRYNSHLAAGQIVFTTFHQNYGYEDFIQGVRPDTSARTMGFKTVDGIFKVIANRALYDPDRDYVIIIDEINRANISKVFGELITLIEDDKRWGEVNAVSAQLPSGEVFAVPNNLYIIGTMNSADKSISLIDTALRRRFTFVEFEPRLELIEDSQLRVVLERINTGISEELSSTDLLVGHSYFMHKSISNLCEIMNKSIIPLLYEYFFDNQRKVLTLVNKAIEGMNFAAVSSPLGRVKLVRKDAE